ncbi:serine/threonine-protein kinase [Microbispora sp. H11081]|uniref:serine/threonine-protein kinase n=1 Tax=Microbispora sp. H11081 TaxID=2729107 RepID=UPI00147340AD|nr:serine/threonine-protein kinase [Microbispora sp. H11081]
MRHEEPPKKIGRYSPQSHLATGGMGRVFLALDPEGRTVAVKQLHPGIAHESGMRERLRREVEVMRRIRSARVAELVDADMEADPPYIVTRYVQGRTLHSLVDEEGPLRGDALLRMAYGIAEALVAIHDAGHVHRDLKPSNVMVAGGEPVVIDFGIAREHDATRLTHEGAAIGTVGYIPPEVLEGAVAGPPADVFAWGATVAYAATGRPAFGTGGMQAVALRAYRGAADLDGVPGEFRQLLTAALAPRADVRPDARTLVRALSDHPAGFTMDPAAVDPVPAPGSGAATPGTEPVRPGRRRALAIGAGAAAAAVLVSGSLLVGRFGARADPPQASPSLSPVAAPSRPSYQATVANGQAGQKLMDFLADNAGKKVLFFAPLDAGITPYAGGGEPFDSFGKNDMALFTFWPECRENLDPGEQPTSLKCEGVQVTILGEQPARVGLQYTNGFYRVQGNFEVSADGTHQGIHAFTLKPVEAA